MLIGRRATLAGLGAMGVSGLFPGIASAQARARSRVATAQGTAVGREVDGIHVFKGMRYGASTEGRRFLPPVAPPSWSGDFEAVEFGHQAPQTPNPIAGEEPMSEDCLRINIWTPRPDGQRRPVMLWFHGGGFEIGTGSSALYDGTALAKRGDVVVATINHRLNVFGHCHLAPALGDEYRSSGNVGTMDLVRAMRWVRENIASFGGDPDNVTIFGQSGGGRKVSMCFGSPLAAGLFDRGIVQSGSHLLVHTPEKAANLVTLLMKELGLAAGEESKLLTVPQTTLSEAQLAAITAAGYRFEPMLDGIVLPEQPFFPRAPQFSAHVPMMLGTMRTELSAPLGAARPALLDLKEEHLAAALTRYVGEGNEARAIAAFREVDADLPAAELFFRAATGRAYDRDATLMAEARAAQGRNHTWLYKLTWPTPVHPGHSFSPHSLDLPFMFDNVTKGSGPRMAGPRTEQTDAMSEAMAETWLAFARSGDPNNAAIPTWAPYEVENRTTMLFDVPPTVANDPFKAEREFMATFPTTQGGDGRYRGL